MESSPFLSEIEIDLFPANEGQVVINSGGGLTTTRTVNLSISIPQNASEMMVCEANDFSGCSWETPANERAFTFSGEGDRTVYLSYKDKDGFVSEAHSSSINVDLFDDGEGSIIIDSGNSSTNIRIVTITISAPAKATHIQFCENSQFNACDTWQNVSQSTVYTFSGDGNNALYARFRDKDGFISHTVSSTIIVDTTGPTVSNNAIAAIPYQRSIALSWATSSDNITGSPGVDPAV